MADIFRWGILGTGNIARKFAQGLTAVAGAQLYAVGSRKLDTAAAFADEFDAPQRHASYEALANDPQVDAIYVCTPHPFHQDNARLCLQAGKPVLCEKPFAINAAEAEAAIACAREQKVFLMEAMWTRFIPAIAKVREWLQAGKIGEPRMLAADFGFRGGWNPEGRLLNPRLGGGALLDVGIYPVSLASMVFGGPPRRVASLAHLGETGVDEQAGMVFQYPQGRLAMLSCAVRTGTTGEARIFGTEGSIHIHSPFWQATRLTFKSGEKEEVIELPLEGNGFNYEAAEVMHCVRAGKLESATMPLDETLSLMKTLDEIRAQWGLKYPME